MLRSSSNHVYRVTVAIGGGYELFRTGVRRLLESNGVELVGEASTDHEILRLVGDTKPAVLLLDRDAGITGLDLLRDVQKRSRSTRVLVLSADDSMESVVAALRDGAMGYLTRTAPLDMLLEAVAAVGRGQRYLSPEVSHAVAGGVGHGLLEQHADPYEALSRRQREVFRLVAEGLSNREIAAHLFISPRTAETHRALALRRLGLRTHIEVVRFALRRRLLKAEA